MPHTGLKRAEGGGSGARSRWFGEKVVELTEIASAYRRAIPLLTANQLRIFDSIAGRPAAARSVARRLGLERRACTILLDALTAMGLLTKRKGLYACSQFVRRTLVSGARGYMGNMLDHHLDLLQAWMELPDVMRHGGPSAPRSRKRSPQEHRAFILGMSDIGRRSAAVMLDVIDLSGFSRMLDLGGGPGSYSIAICKENNRLRAVVFDLPETAPIAREEIRRAGLHDRIEVVGGDYFRDPIGSGYDIILVSNVVHGLPLEMTVTLLRKVHRALEPGGTVIVKDFYINENRTRPLESALFAINMLVSTTGGNCYTPSELKGAIRAAGFIGVRRYPVATVSSLYLGRKRKSVRAPSRGTKARFDRLCR